MKEPLSEIFKEGGHKNSLGRSEEVLGEVLENKERLPELYESISDPDAWVRMRAIDTLEKVFRVHPDWAEPYIDDIFCNLLELDQASIQWHLAQIFTTIELNKSYKLRAIDWMSTLLSTTSVDWIVAVNAMNTLKTFTEEGWLKRSKFKSLVTIQLKHTSKSVVKRAHMYLREI